MTKYNYKQLIRNLRKGNYREKPRIQGSMDTVEGREGRGKPEAEPRDESSDGRE